MHSTHIPSLPIERPSSCVRHLAVSYLLRKGVLNVEPLYLHATSIARGPISPQVRKSTMVNFAELKAKAEKAKDAGITKVTNTRDRYTSIPSSKANWDPNWKRAPPPPATASPRTSTSGPPPPPLRSRPDVLASSTGTAPPAVPRASRPTDDLPAPPSYIPRPPPTRAASGYPPSHRDTSQDAVNRIDWANLSPEDKEELFGWLDEFFSRYLGIELSPRERRPALPVHRMQNTRPPPTVNIVTRPQV